jgi:hypothetical protein
MQTSCLLILAAFIFFINFSNYYYGMVTNRILEILTYESRDLSQIRSQLIEEEWINDDPFYIDYVLEILHSLHKKNLILCDQTNSVIVYRKAS